MDAAASRHREIFRAMARSSIRAAYRGALAVVTRRADAEDVAQDALLAAFEKLDSCRDPERLRPWLLRIVRNRALNHLERRRLRDVPAVEPGEAGGWGALDLHHPGMPDVALRARLVGALARLGTTPREVVLLHDTQGWTHEEIAQHLGISVPMSRKHLFQARGLLRRLLSAEHAERESLSGNAAAPSWVMAHRAARPLHGAQRSGSSNRRKEAR